jgi:fumarylpyruvate hydrolase
MPRCLCRSDRPASSVSRESNVHHEIELVVAIGKRAAGFRGDAVRYIYGYAVGLDMTRRDLQFALRDKGRPWDISKGFDASAPISPIKTIATTGEITTAQIWLNVNGAKRQASDVAKLIWSVNETIEHLSKFYEPGRAT